MLTKAARRKGQLHAKVRNRAAAAEHYKQLEKQLVGTTIGGILIDALVIKESKNRNDRCWVTGACPDGHRVEVRLGSLRSIAKHGGIGCRVCRARKSSQRAPISFARQIAGMKSGWKKHSHSVFRCGEWWDDQTIVLPALKIGRTALRRWSRPSRKRPASIDTITEASHTGREFHYYLRADWQREQKKMAAAGGAPAEGTNGHAPAATPGPAEKPRRKSSEAAKSVREYCYNGLADGRKASVIAREINAKREFRRRMQRTNVWTEARRFAEAEGRPWPPKRTQN